MVEFFFFSFSFRFFRAWKSEIENMYRVFHLETAKAEPAESRKKEFMISLLELCKKLYF